MSEFSLASPKFSLPSTKSGYGIWSISKEFHFAYSHQLNNLPEGHPCGRVHGHNGILVVELEGTSLNDAGFVKDYRDLSPIKDFIDEHLDHYHWNDVFEFQPSSENIAKFFYFLCRDEYGWPVKRIGFSETPKTWCWYEREN